MSHGKNQSHQLVNVLCSLRSSQEVKGNSSCSHLVCRDLGNGYILSNSLGQRLIPQASLKASFLIGSYLNTRVTRRILSTGAYGPSGCETLNIQTWINS